MNEQNKGNKYTIGKIGVVLICIAFGVYLFCDNSYIPTSYIGKSNIIIVTLITAFRLFSWFFMWWFGGYLLIRAIYKYGYNLPYEKIVQPVLIIAVAITILILPFKFYFSRTDPYFYGDDIIHDLMLPFYVISDMAKDDTETIEFNKCSINTFGNREPFGSLDGGHSYEQYILKCDGKTFRIGSSDDVKFKQFVPSYPYYDENAIAVVEYYSKSGFIKSVNFIIPDPKPEKADIIPEEIEIWLEEKDDGIILVHRPEVTNYETMFWYITKNGDFYNYKNASFKSWENYLSFAHRGEYTITLVVNYNEETGEYTPISNTIEYTIE